MSLYAAQPGRLVRQVVTDLLYVAVVVGAVWLALQLQDAVLGLRGPGEDVETAGQGLSGGLSDAGDFLGGVPFVGGEVSAPFADAADAADRMAAAGADAAVAVERLAFWLAVVVAAVPIVLVSFQYLPGRLLFVRESSALRRLGGRGVAGYGPAELDLLALRALTRQPLGLVRRIGDDVAERWRDGDPAVVRELAALELRASGLRPPRGPRRPPSPPSAAPGPGTASPGAPGRPAPTPTAVRPPHQGETR